MPNFKGCTYTTLAAKAQALLCEGMSPLIANCNGCVYTVLAVGLRSHLMNGHWLLPVGSVRVLSQISTAALQHC